MRGNLNEETLLCLDLHLLTNSLEGDDIEDREEQSNLRRMDCEMSIDVMSV